MQTPRPAIRDRPTAASLQAAARLALLVRRRPGCRRRRGRFRRVDVADGALAHPREADRGARLGIVRVDPAAPTSAAELAGTTPSSEASPLAGARSQSHASGALTPVFRTKTSRRPIRGGRPWRPPLLTIVTRSFSPTWPAPRAQTRDHALRRCYWKLRATRIVRCLTVTGVRDRNGRSRRRPKSGLSARLPRGEGLHFCSGAGPTPVSALRWGGRRYRR